VSFYIRKSIRVGPIRFNLSKSGIGVSGGIPGFRVGSGPRGNYIHMGRGGVYYRSSLGAVRQQSVRQERLQQPPTTTLSAIDSADVSQMVDGNSQSLLDDLNAKLNAFRFLPLVLLGSFAAIGAACLFKIPTALIGLVAFIGLVLCIITWMIDQERTRAVLLYDLDDDAQARFQQMHQSLERLSMCQGIWHISAAGAVGNRKIHGGASTHISRSRIAIDFSPPPRIKTNVPVPTIPAGRQRLCFLPDRLLVIDGKRAGAVSYSALHLDVQDSRYIETETVPRDARVIDTTWQYVNKKGGPDRRFKDNREVPIVLYEELRFASATGLNEVIQISAIGRAAGLVRACRSAG
jgi:hypothetical protein